MMMVRKAPYWGGPGGTRNIMVARKRVTYKRKRFVKGRDRTVGNYLRFSGPGVTRPEKKFFDTDLSTAFGTTAAVIDSICKIPQGIAGDERIGRKITITKLKIRYTISLPAQVDSNNLDSGDVARVIFFIDKQTNGSAALGADILKTNTKFQSYRLLSNVGRFVILMDKMHTLNYLTMLSEGGTSSQFTNLTFAEYHFNKSLNLPIEFSGVVGAITELQSGNIGVMVISKTGKAEFNGHTRIRYADC